jgi:hypothetical protein
MNTKLVKLLASVCIGLCLIIAVEWLYASYMRHRLLTSISSEKQRDYKAEELPEIDLTKNQEESYADLVARPLFIKGRRPVDEPRTEAEQAAAKTEGFDWQLTGVYSSQKNVSALFSRSKAKVAKDSHRKLTVGDDLDGWKLTEINKDRAVLRQGGNKKELLLRKPKPKALPPPMGNGAPPPAPIPSPRSISEPPGDASPGTNEDTTENNP